MNNDILEKYPLRALYVNPTFKCNLTCEHCWVGAGGNNFEELSLDYFTGVIDQAIPLGLKKIKFTGGEPLLRRETKDLLIYAHSKGLVVDMETNGTLIDRETASLLREVRVGTISISLDSGIPKFHDGKRRKMGAFREAIEGIKNLNSFGLKPQIVMSLFRGDFDRNLSSIVDLEGEVNISSIKINPIMNIGRGEQLNDKYSLEEVLAIYYKTSDLKIDLQIFFDLPPALKRLKDVSRTLNRCGILGVMGVLPHGKVSICGVGHPIPQLSHNVKYSKESEGKSVKEIWVKGRVFNELREILPDKLEGVCRRCIWKRYCKGKCVAYTYAVNGTFKAPYPVCQEAYDSGLFPARALLNGKEQI